MGFAPDSNIANPASLSGTGDVQKISEPAPCLGNSASTHDGGSVAQGEITTVKKEGDDRDDSGV